MGAGLELANQRGGVRVTLISNPAVESTLLCTFNGATSPPKTIQSYRFVFACMGDRSRARPIARIHECMYVWLPCRLEYAVLAYFIGMHVRLLCMDENLRGRRPTMDFRGGVFQTLATQ
jgi:hypothetical protein